MPTVLVTDANRGSAITVMRSLDRKGWTVVAADATRHSLGFRSRHARHRHVYPSPGAEPEAFVNSLSEVVSRYGVDLLIPITDETILPLARARIRFAGQCDLAIAGDKALSVVMDKQATLDLCEELGIPVPETYVACSVEEAQEVAHLLPWPIVLKAQRSRRLVKGAGVQRTGAVGYANTVKELIDQAERLIEHGPILLQGYQPGAGQGVEMLAHEGRPLAIFQHRRLAEVPITGGASAWRESVPLDPALVDYSRRLVEALHWTGLIMVEFKVGESDLALMEVNGRVWGSLPLAVHSGMDFPARLADLHLNGSPPAGPPATDYRVGVRASNLDLMALWFVQALRKKRRYPFIPQPGRRDALRVLLGMFERRQKFDVQSWSDPWPGLLQIGTTLARLGRKAAAAG
jgi:predicted ATP-grasp superfamily ATP-dependent carboligase